MKYPVNIPKIWGEEHKLVRDCLDSGWISSAGEYVNIFEDMLAKLTNRDYCTTVSNGTVALEIAIKSLGLKKGDEVILPNFTIISALPTILELGLKPIFIEPTDGFNVCPLKLIEQISNKTKCIIITHIYCFPVDLDPLLAEARRRGIWIIEDSAEMLGQHYKGKPCGSFGDISTFSFFANKIITTGEGGAILSNNISIHKKILKLKNLGFGKNRFIHHTFGTNARLTNLQCALGIGQLKNLKKAVKIKKKIGKIYNKHLSRIDFFELQPATKKYAENIYWVYPIILKKEGTKDFIIKELYNHGVDTRPFFYPLDHQPALKTFHINPIKKSNSNSLRLYENGFYVPSGIGMNLEHIPQICDILIKSSAKIF